MARLAESSEIGLVVRPTPREGQDVVYLRRGGGSSVLHALCAQWMRREEPRAHFLPLISIALLRCGVALVAVVMRRHPLLVLRAIPLVGQRRAAGVAAGFHCFVWHASPPLQRIRKAPQDFSREARAPNSVILIVPRRNPLCKGASTLKHSHSLSAVPPLQGRRCGAGKPGPRCNEAHLRLPPTVCR